MAIWIKPSGMEIEINDDERNLKACVLLGWKLKEEDLVNDGEKGNGEPGTKEWHEAAIKGLSSAQEVVEYMNTLGAEMSGEGQLRTVKKTAIKLLNEVL